MLHFTVLRNYVLTHTGLPHSALHFTSYSFSILQWHRKSRDGLDTEQSNSSKLNPWALVPMELSTRPCVMSCPALGRFSTLPSLSPMTLEQ